MQIRRLMLVVLLMLFILFSNVCSAAEVSVNLTAGNIEQDLRIVEAKIASIHDRMNKEQYNVIVEDASDLMKRALGQENLLNTFKKFRQDLGRFVAVKDKKLNFIMGAPIQIRAVYTSTFENMEVTEFFGFINDNGTYRLTGYQIAKGAIDLKFLEYMDWNKKANDNYRNGNFAKAIEEYSTSITIYPNVDAYIGRALAYTSRKEFVAAFDDLDKALEVKPGAAAVVYYHRGNVYFAQKDYDSAMVEFDKALEREPNLAMALYSKGRVFEEKNENQQAINQYEEFIKRSYASGMFNIYVIDDAKKRIERLKLNVN